MKKNLRKIISMALATATITSAVSSIPALAEKNDLTQTEILNDVVETHAATSAVYSGNPITPEVAVYDDDGTLLTKNVDYELSYENNINVGTAYIIVTFKGNYEGTKRVPFEISPRVLSESDVTVPDFENVTYSGIATEPVPTVTYKDKTLVKDTDYSVTYENNVNAGEASVIINFVGNYSGTVTKHFHINAKEVPSDEIIVSDINDHEYTGEPLTPEPDVKYNNVTLVKDKDYTLSYENNDTIGTAKAIITLTGNYAGTKEVTFEITPIVIDVSKVVISKIEKQSFTGQNVTPEPVITYNNVALTKDKDYVLS